MTGYRATAAQAGLEVMGEILDILHNRETVDAARLSALSVDDITDLYESFIGPAIDRVEEDLGA